MGRPRKPLEMQRGNLTVISMERRKNEEKKVKTGSNQLSRPPDWLSDCGKEPYGRYPERLC